MVESDGYFDSGAEEHVLVLMAALCVRASGCLKGGQPAVVGREEQDWEGGVQ